MKPELKNAFISTARIAIASIVGGVLAFLTARGFIDPEATEAFETFIEVASVITGTVVYYFAGRLMEKVFPMMGFRNPESIKDDQ